MNYWEPIAEILGVELGEEFEIEGKYRKYKICDNGLLCYVGNMYGFETNLDWEPESSDVFYDIISGKKKIIKKPWIPKRGDKYWAVMLYEEICSYIWDNTLLDYAFLKSGWIFRTKEEAEANRDRILSEYEKIKEGELD